MWKEGVIMQRFAMDKLLHWKDKDNRKPLVIMGARQVGKTWLMKSLVRLIIRKWHIFLFIIMIVWIRYSRWILM